MKKRNIILIIIAAVIVLVGAGLLLAYRFGWFQKASKQEIRYMTLINEANSIIYYYGEPDPGREITLNLKKVTEFTDATIGDGDRKYDYHAILIFDFDGTMNISDSELELIKSYCETKGYDMLYYGRAHLDDFECCGYFSSISDSEYGFIYNGSYWNHRDGIEEWINPYLLTGNWTLEDHNYYGEDDSEKMWKFVVDCIADLVNDSMEGA